MPGASKQPVLAQGDHCNKSLYKLNGETHTVVQTSVAWATPSLETWHGCLGHINYKTIIKMSKDELATGMCSNLLTLPPACQHCILRKQTKRAMLRTRQGERPMDVLETVYSNLTGPEEVASVGGAKYIMNLVDNYLSMCEGDTEMRPLGQ